MGTSTNKSTRKFSKRHLAKELSKRKKSQRIQKQKTEKDAKFQKAVRMKVEKDKNLEEQISAEKKRQVEKERFLERSHSETDSDLEEIAPDDNSHDLSDEIEMDQKPSSKGMTSKNDSKEKYLNEGSSEEDEEVQTEIVRYKQQLAKLKDEDPEFYRYLKEADDQLLQFHLSSDDETYPHSTPSSEKQAMHQLTFEQVEGWCKDVMSEEKPIESLKCLTTAFAFACQYGESNENEPSNLHNLLQFSNSTVYSKLMIFMIKEGDSIFRRYLGLKKKNIKKNGILSATKKHSEVAFHMMRFMTNVCRLLKQSLEDNAMAFVLRHIRPCVPLMDGMPAKIPKLFVSVALEIFVKDNPAPRLQAVLLIREMVLQLGDHTIERSLKGVYNAFRSACGNISVQAVPQIYFMGTCVIEIYSLCPESAYQNAFKFIKELAVDLREAILLKDKNAWKKVFCWKFVLSLELWARLIGSLYDKGDLQQLLYPVAQLLTGTARYQDQMKFLPLRLRLISAANQLSQSTGVFIPISSLLIGTLAWSLLHKKPVLSKNEKCPNLALCLSVDEKTLKNNAFQNEVAEQIFELLTQHLAQFSHSIAFPETSHWIATHLKKFAKTVQYPKQSIPFRILTLLRSRYKTGAMQLLTAIKESAEKVLSRRMLVSFSPRDIPQVERFESEGKALGESPLEILCRKLETKRKQRNASQSTDQIVLDASEPEPRQETKKTKRKRIVSLSDAESLTSDEGELDEEELKPVLDTVPMEPDILEEYVPSENEDEALFEHSKSNGTKESLPKQKRRKEKRKNKRKLSKSK